MVTTDTVTDPMLALLLVTRNEADLLAHNLRHHLEWGFDRIAVADNDSTDATREVVAEFGPAVTYRRFADFATRQTQRLEMLAEIDEREGGRVEWAAIGDTDELFWSPRPLPDLLAEAPAGAVAVNFDSKLFLPTALDPAVGSVAARRSYRAAGHDSPLDTSYREGKTVYRVPWLRSLPLDHNCPNHEHECRLVPEHVRHPEAIVHHYMIQDEEQFVEKVVRLINWATPPRKLGARLRWNLTPRDRRPLPGWSSPYKKEWWDVYRSGGVEAVRAYYRDVYVLSAERVAAALADGSLVHDGAFAAHLAGR